MKDLPQRSDRRFSYEVKKYVEFILVSEFILFFVWQWGGEERFKRQSTGGRKYHRIEWDIVKGYLSKDFCGHM